MTTNKQGGDKQYGSGTPGNQGTQSGVGAQPQGGGAGLGSNVTGGESAGSGGRAYSGTQSDNGRSVSGMNQGDEQYWRDSYQNEPYYNNQYSFDDYAPAYRMGHEGQRSGRFSGQSWDQARGSLESEWQAGRGNSRMDWKNAEPAARAAYVRSQDSGSGDRNTASGSSTRDLNP